MFVLFLGLLDWLLGERHVPVLTEEIALFYTWMARATLTAAIAWIAYFAVEPYVRRFWPQILITWNRLLEGKFRDPLVGRDILIGSLCGILLVLVVQLDVLLPARLGSLPPLPKLPATPHDLGAVLGLRSKLSILVTALMTSITLALVLPLLMLALRALIRMPWLSAAAFWLLLSVLEVLATGQDASFPWLTSGLAAGVAVVLLMRLGLVGAHRNPVCQLRPHEQSDHCGPSSVVCAGQCLRHTLRWRCWPMVFSPLGRVSRFSGIAGSMANVRKNSRNEEAYGVNEIADGLRPNKKSRPKWTAVHISRKGHFYGVIDNLCQLC